MQNRGKRLPRSWREGLNDNTLQEGIKEGGMWFHKPNPAVLSNNNINETVS
jgi:hypothetical protein